MEKKTPLYEDHVNLKGKIVPFAGYLLPVQYEDTGLTKEHMATREACGLFDVSHMGEIMCTGKDALANLNYILTNDFTNMKIGQARYTVMCYENGGSVDDLIVYKLGEEKYMLVPNASNKDKDYAHILKYAFGDVKFEDISDTIAQIAVQGPKAQGIMEKLSNDLPEKYYTATPDGKVGDITCLISKTGYTGEDGYELYCNSADASKLWNMLLEAGKEEGILPCGLGARDTLRLEASMPLYGHELDENTTPLQAGLKFAVKLDKEKFVGKEAMVEVPITRKRVGLKVTGRGIVREDAELYIGDKLIGKTTSGTQVPFLNLPVAMAYVDVDCTEVGTAVTAVVRGRKVETEIIPLPFYKK